MLVRTDVQKLQRSAGHIDLNGTENDVRAQVNDTTDANELVIAINAERLGRARAGVLRVLCGRHLELTQAQRSLVKTIDPSLSQRLMVSQTRRSDTRCPVTPVVHPHKRRRFETPEIDLTQPEQHIYDAVKESQDPQELRAAISTEKASSRRMYVLRLLRGRLNYLLGQRSRHTHADLSPHKRQQIRGQRSRRTHVDLSLSQERIRGQCRALEDTQELCRALQEERDNSNRESVVKLLRARIKQVQARHR